MLDIDLLMDLDLRKVFPKLFQGYPILKWRVIKEEFFFCGLLFFLIIMQNTFSESGLGCFYPFLFPLSSLLLVIITLLLVRFPISQEWFFRSHFINHPPWFGWGGGGLLINIQHYHILPGQMAGETPSSPHLPAPGNARVVKFSPAMGPHGSRSRARSANSMNLPRRLRTDLRVATRFQARSWGDWDILGLGWGTWQM